MYQVDGYDFSDKALADKAEIEAEGIRYIKEHTNFEDPEHVLKLYCQMIKEKMFETPVGITFLKELQVYLLEYPQMEKTRVPDIPVSLPLVSSEEQGSSQEAKEKDEGKKQKESKKEKTKEEKLEKAEIKKTKIEKQFAYYRFSTYVLIAIVLGMFFITFLSTNNVTILNYENQVINKYEKWEQELEKKEAELKEREDALQK